MENIKVFESLAEAIGWTSKCRRNGARVGSVHTLGALHVGHGAVIRRMSAENDEAIVSIYPNRSQFAPGTIYKYDLAADIALAEACGATAVIAPSDDEIFPSTYGTFLDQGPCFARMDGMVAPYLFRGMITMSFRWVNALRPDSTYWGLKDIAQSLLVERALRDFMVPVEFRRVPCVRTRSGIPVSSRLRSLDAAARADIGRLYRSLQSGRLASSNAGATRADVVAAMRTALAADPFQHFCLRYLDCFNPHDFSYPEQIQRPVILHAAISRDGLNHFDGLLIETEHDLRNGPEVIWIEDKEFFGGSA